MWDLKRNSYLTGFQIIVAGRLTRKERAAFMIRKSGRISFSSKNRDVHYACDGKIMRFGMVGVKIWFNYKRKRPAIYKLTFIHKN